MKIAFAHHLSLSYFGGGERFIVEFANELVKRGHEVSVYALPFLLDGVAKVEPKGLLADGIRYVEGLWHKVEADVTYVTFHPLNWLSFKTGRPRIAGIHAQSYWSKINLKYGLLPNLANLVNRFVGGFEFKRFDAVHVVTNVYHVGHPRVFFIPNFVDAEKFRPADMKDDVFSVAFLGRAVWQKGYDVFQVVKEKLPSDISVRVSGGQIPEDALPSFISQSHVVLVPSRVDTFGLSIVESMLCETPCITTPLETHKALGLPLFYADSPNEFLNQINFLHGLWRSEPSKYFELAKECRRSALKYDKAVIVDRLEKMLECVSHK